MQASGWRNNLLYYASYWTDSIVISESKSMLVYTLDSSPIQPLHPSPPPSPLSILVFEFQGEKKAMQRGGEKKSSNIHNNQRAFTDCLDHTKQYLASLPSYS